MQIREGILIILKKNLQKGKKFEVNFQFWKSFGSS